MTTGLREGLGLHADALTLRGYRNTLLASNIANAAVPHYKARDFDFEQVLADRTGSLATLRATETGHMPTAQAALSDEAGYRVPVMPALDGNTVDMAVEQMEFAENTVRYQASLEFLNRRVSGLMSVIRGE